MNLSKCDIIDLLLELGYKIILDPVENHHVATHDDFNVRVLWRENKENDDAYIASVQTRNSEKSKSYHNYPIQNEPITTESIQRIINARGYVKNLSLDNLPKPFNYRTDTIKLVNGEWTRIALLRQARVVRIGGITKSLDISDDIITDPRVQPWYVIKAETFNNRTIDFISTDQSWYPINRYSKKVTTDIRPHVDVDLTQLSSIDFELISKAIAEFNGSL